LGEEVSEVQQSQKFIEQMDSTEVGQTTMIAGEFYISGRVGHFKEFLTNS
jgi:hypothetical protein